MIDSRKLTKDFIDFICLMVENEYGLYKNDSFIESLRGDEAYAVKDKGIEKRIQNKLYKKLKLKSKVIYRIDPRTGEGILYIKLLKEEYYPTIQFRGELQNKLFEQHEQYMKFEQIVNSSLGVSKELLGGINND